MKRFVFSHSSLGILSLFVGLLCYGIPKSPDVSQGFFHIFGAFLLFLSFFAAQFSWGSVIRKSLGQDMKYWECFFWGSLLFALLTAILGYFPILGESSRPYWLGFCLLGFALNLPSDQRKFLSLEIHRIDFLMAVPLLLAFIGALAAHGFWDSLWYHLTTSRVWFEAGRIVMQSYFPISMKTGLWDYQFLFGQIFLGAKGDGGLISAQLFGQWLNLSALFLCYLLLREECKILGLTPFSCALAILGTELFMMAEFAKNDWGSVFWGLSFAIFYLKKERSFLIALAAAACFTAKFTSAFFLLPLFLWLIWESPSFCSLVSLFSYFILFCAPILVRNIYFTKNPFFPSFSAYFPSLMGPSWRGISEYEANTWQMHAVLAKLSFLFRDSWILAGLLLLPFVKPIFSIEQKKILYATLISLLLFLFFSGPKAEWRLASAALLLAAAYGARTWESFLEQRKFPSRFLPALFCMMIMALPIDWGAPRKLLFGPQLVEQARGWVSASVVAWTRLNLPADAKIATLNEQRTYYLFPHLPLRVFDIPDLDRKLSAAKDVGEANGAIQSYGIRYLVLSAEFLDSYYDRKICDWFYQASEANPQAVLFKTEYARLLDLKLLH